ncbi:MAG: hypothetical protein LQ350_006941 [Teloschistes chrysophthalmus]|nr:MAG: hypothetical protein LQ350_006941 [Niorma chrysophthalma]
MELLNHSIMDENSPSGMSDKVPGGRIVTGPKSEDDAFEAETSTWPCGGESDEATLLDQQRLIIRTAKYERCGVV